MSALAALPKSNQSRKAQAVANFSQKILSSLPRNEFWGWQGHEGSVVSFIARETKATFGGVFELGQPSLCRRDTIGLRMHPSKDAVSDLGRSC